MGILNRSNLMPAAPKPVDNDQDMDKESTGSARKYANEKELRIIMPKW